YHPPGGSCCPRSGYREPHADALPAERCRGQRLAERTLLLAGGGRSTASAYIHLRPRDLRSAAGVRPAGECTGAELEQVSLYTRHLIDVVRPRGARGLISRRNG